ncbi:MAG: O-antigen ligase family protein [Elusimicrobiota bacterium]
MRILFLPLFMIAILVLVQITFFFFLLLFSGFFKAAHDIWAASVVYLLVLGYSLFRLGRIVLKKDEQGIPGFFLGPVFLILVGFGVSSYYSINPSESVLEWLDWVSALLIFLWILDLGSHERIEKKFLFFSIPFFWFQLFWVLSVDSSGTLINPNLLAAFLAPFFPLIFSQIDKGMFLKKLESFYLLSGIFSYFFTLILLKSNWVYICLPFFMPISFKKKKVLFLITSAIVSSAFIYNFFSLASDRFGADSIIEGVTRLSWWKSGILMFLDHPWFGVGLGNFPSAYLAYKVGNAEHTLYPHNIFIGLLAETGLVGVISISVLIMSIYFYLKKSSYLLSEKKGFFLALILFLLVGIGSLSTEYLSHLLLFFVLLGLFLSSDNIKRIHIRPSIALLVLSIGIASIPFILSPLFASQQFVSGQMALHELKWDEAKKHFHNAIDLQKCDWKSYQALAQIEIAEYNKSQNPANLTQAIEFEKKAISVHRMNGFLWYELGVYQLKAGLKEEAQGSFTNVMKFKTTNKKINDEIPGLIASLSSAS